MVDECRMQEWPGARMVNGGADTLAAVATPPTESQPAEDPRPSVPVSRLYLVMQVFTCHLYEVALPIPTDEEIIASPVVEYVPTDGVYFYVWIYLFRSASPMIKDCE